jgi:hypothetical protein
MVHRGAVGMPRANPSGRVFPVSLTDVASAAG